MSKGHLITSEESKNIHKQYAVDAVLEKLSPGHRKLIEAGLKPMLSQVTVMDAIEQLTDTVNMAYSLCGQKPDEQIVAITVNELYQELMETYSACTIAEVRTAIRYGVLDAYGEYFGLNVKTFFFFIREYLFSEQRHAAREAYAAAQKKKQLELQQRQQQPPPPPYWEDGYWTEVRTGQWRQITENVYEWFLQQSLLKDFIQEGSFWLLYRMGKIKVSPEYKQELQARALQIKRAELIKNDAKKTSDVVQVELETLNCILKNSEMERLVLLIVKRLAVMDFFTELKRKGAVTVF